MHDYRTPEGTYHVSDDRTRAMLQVDDGWICYRARMLPCGKYYFTELFRCKTASQESREEWLTDSLTSTTVP